MSETEFLKVIQSIKDKELADLGHANKSAEITEELIKRLKLSNSI